MGIKKTETLSMDTLKRKFITKGKSKRLWYFRKATEQRKYVQFGVDLCL